MEAAECEVTQPKRVIGTPFKPGNPGRPKGSRNKLADAFVSDVYADWQEHGPQAIVECRQINPAAYLKVIASLLPKDHRISLTDDTELMSDDEVKERIRTLAGKLGVMIERDDARVEQLRAINGGTIGGLSIEAGDKAE